MIDLIEPGLLIERVATKLKSIIDMPEWAKFVKTGINRQRPPVSEDWWFFRAAAILRTVENRGPVGVAKLRTKYGGKKNNGMAPEHFQRSSGKIIRTILQQLETAKLIKQEAIGVHKGRIITPEGKSLLFTTSKEFTPSKPNPIVKKEAPKKEVPKAEVPKVETPVVEKKEVPIIEKKEEVKKEVPKVEAPKVEAPKKEVPKAEVPKVETPVVEKKEEQLKAPEKKVE